VAVHSPLLNLGCGSTPHPAFVNVDLHAGPGVVAHDLRTGVPFPDGTYDLVYHSTMLSHFRRPEAGRFMEECRRVLKPGGVLRVVTEDLEQLAVAYLKKLEAAWCGERSSGHDHEWLMLELYDQATRERPGGDMLPYLSNPGLANEDFVRMRVGEQGAIMIAGARSRARNGRPRRRPSLRHRVRARLRKAVLTAVLGPSGVDAFEVGRFRLSGGSASYYMYDRYSLRELFRAAGFADAVLRTPDTSAYSSWQQVNLDLAPSGAPARPHALIMEGIRT
jgi:hypothetical protein